MSHPAAAQEQDLAFYSERALAFSVDLALAVTGYFVSLWLAFPAFSPRINPHGLVWAYQWATLFLLWQAWESSGGRVSPGKRLVGIRVVGLDGEPLSFPRALMRSAGYLGSSVFYLGFLWPLFNHRVQALHDLAACSLVVQDEPRNGRGWVVGGAWAGGLVLAGHWVWVFALSTPFYRMNTLASAHAGLREVARLEQRYHDIHGRYTDNVFSLARLTGSPKAFFAANAMVFDPEAGIDISLEPKGFSLAATARDERNTRVEFTSAN